MLAKIHARGYKKTLNGVAQDIGHPDFVLRVRQFLYEILHPEEDAAEVPQARLPCTTKHDRIRVFHSATSTFYAPSDVCGVQGMLKERIYSSRLPWRKGPPRHDCIVVNADSDQPGMRGLHVAQVLCFFSIRYQEREHPCAFVRWFIPVSGDPCPLTGMWKVAPEFLGNEPRTAVISINSVIRSAHLIPVFTHEPLPEGIHPNQVLEKFDEYYVNKYADHHSHEILF